MSILKSYIDSVIRRICNQLNFKYINNLSKKMGPMFSQSNSLLLVTDNNEGAKAILDQEPAITPITKAKANQYKVDPPQINIQISGNSVVRLVYRVLVKVAPTALSIWYLNVN